MKNALSAILDNIEVLVYVADFKTYEILYINDYTRRLFGDIKGKICWRALQAEQDGQCSFCTNDKIITAEGKPTGVYHWEFQNTVTGKWFDIRDTAIKWQDGRMVRLEVATDITKRKEAENALLESEAKYGNLFQYSNDAIFIHDLDGNILDVNEQCTHLFGYSKSEILRLKVMALHPPEALESAKWALDIIAKKGFVNFEIAFKKKNGECIIADVSSCIFEINYKKVIQGIVRDVSERKRMEKDRVQLLSELKQKNKELEQILYVASHDLRSPLANIVGFSKELDYSLQGLISFLDSDKVPPEIKNEISSIVNKDIPESITYIQNSSSKMNILISGILKISRTGRDQLNIENLDMNKMIDNTVSNYEFKIREEGVKIEISSLPSCKGDKAKVNQLFSNIIDNAIKYIDPNRPGLIKIFGNKERDQSIYCIEDNGIGIAPEYQEKIFEIFHRLDLGKAEGEGLGLTIAHRIVEMHKGKIWVESKLNIGSKFFVSLPS